MTTMAFKSKANSRMFESSSETSYRSKILKRESEMTAVVKTLVSRYQNSVDKRQDLTHSGGIWDWNPNDMQLNFDSMTKTCPGIDVDTETVDYVAETAEKQSVASNWKTSKIETEVPVQEPSRSVLEDCSALEDLFPGLSSIGHVAKCVNVQLPVKQNEPKLNAPNNQLPSKNEISKYESPEMFRPKKVSKTTPATFGVCMQHEFGGPSDNTESSVGMAKISNSAGNESRSFQVSQTTQSQQSLKDRKQQSTYPYTGKNKRNKVHCETGENARSMLKKASLPKSIDGKKSFEEWSRERLNNKNSPPRGQVTPPIQTIATSNHNLDKERLQEIEWDYFYGVRSEFDIYDLENYHPDVIMVDGALQSADEAQPGQLETLGSKECKQLCTVLEFLEMLSKLEEIENEQYSGRRKPNSTMKHCYQSRYYQSRYYQSRYYKDYYLETSDAMIILQVADDKGNMENELPVLGMEIFEIKESFPLIFDVIPAVDMEDITLPFSARAMTIVFRCVFGASYQLPSWEVSVEVYAIAKQYKIQELKESCESYFNCNPIATDNIMIVLRLAAYFEVVEVQCNAKTFPVSEKPPNPTGIKTKICIVSCCMDMEPWEALVPLFYSKGDLGGIRKSDFRNEMEIKCVQGVHTITGVQIKFELDVSDKGKEVHIDGEITKSNGEVLEIEKDTQLQARIAFNFDKKLCLRPNESIKIVILIDDIKSSWCNCLKKEKIECRNERGILRMGFKSHHKTSMKQSLFFIDKVFCMI